MLHSEESSDDCAHGGDKSSSRSLRPWPRRCTTSQDVIPQRAVLRVPQMAEQLVTEPTPSFEVFEVEVEEEEEEEQRPTGRSWCLVDGPAVVYWWMMGTSHVQWTPPEGYTARPGRYTNASRRGGDVPGTVQRQFPAVL